MCVRKTTEQFIKEAKLIWGDKYDYSETEYVDARTKVKIIYNNFVYLQTPDKHLRRKSPEKCSKLEANNITFIKKAIKLWGNKYDYSKVNYIDNTIDVEILHNGTVYLQTPQNHLQGNAPEKHYKNTKTTENFINQAKKIWGDKYDYSLTVYVDKNTKLKIIFEDKIYEQIPNSHLKGYAPENIFKSNKKFIEDAKLIHGDMFDYSETEYTGSENMIKLIYNDKIYYQKAATHLRGKVPIELKPVSKGVNKIIEILNKHNIHFTREHKYKKCKNKYCLPFDFHLTDYDVLMEYDGQQHTEPIKFFGGEEGFIYRLGNDNIKNKFAENEGIPLKRISYLEYDKIEEIVLNYIEEIKHRKINKLL